jgi:hypothetical protein
MVITALSWGDKLILQIKREFPFLVSSCTRSARGVSVVVVVALLRPPAPGLLRSGLEFDAVVDAGVVVVIGLLVLPYINKTSLEHWRPKERAFYYYLKICKHTQTREIRETTMKRF